MGNMLDFEPRVGFLVLSFDPLPQGCLMATPMAFILPTASYLRLSRRRQSHWYSRDRLTAWTVMIIGFIVMVIGTALSIEQVKYLLCVCVCVCLHACMHACTLIFTPTLTTLP